MAVAAADLYLLFMGKDEDKAMANTNVIDFERAAQHRQARRSGHAVHGNDRQSWRNRYRDGIDGLLAMPEAWMASAEILPFVTAANRPSA